MERSILKKIIIDTSTVIAVALNEPEKKNLIKMTENSELIAPSSLHWEVGNAFSAMFKRKKLSLNEAIKGLREYKKIPIQFADIDIEDAIKIANKSDIYAYDAYLISCSKKYNVPLLTLDTYLQKIALKNNVEILEA